MVHGFCTCESTCLITFICNPEINSHGAFVVVCPCAEWEDLSCWMCMCPAQVRQQHCLVSAAMQETDTLPCVCCHFFHIFVLLVISLFKMALKYTGVLFSLSSSKKTDVS